MKIGVKYCGGCNPQFDRIELVKTLKDKYVDICFGPALENEFYDVILFINGCSRSCAIHEELKGKEKIFIKSRQDLDRVTKIIDELIKS